MQDAGDAPGCQLVLPMPPVTVSGQGQQHLLEKDMIIKGSKP